MSHNQPKFDLKTDFIIGVDFMEQHNYVIDMANKRITQVKKNYKYNPKSTITSPRNLYLDPCEIATVQVRAPVGMKNAKPGTNFLVKGEWIPDGLCTLKENGTANVIIANNYPEN